MAASVVALLVAAGVGIEVSGRGHEILATPPATVNPSTPSAHLAVTLTPPDGELDADYHPVMSVDGEYVAAVGASPNQSSIYVWNTTAGSKSAKRFSLPSGRQAIPCAFTSDDTALIAISYVSSARKSTIYRVALSSGRLTFIRGFSTSLNLAVSPDGSTLAAENSAGTGIDMWDLNGGASIGNFPLKPTAALVPESLQLDDSGEELIISDKAGTAYVTVPGVPKPSTMPYYTANGDVPLLSPDGSTVLVPIANGGWKLLSVGSAGSSLSDITPHGSYWPKSNGGVLFSPDGKTILTFRNRGVTNDLWGRLASRVIAWREGARQRSVRYHLLLELAGQATDTHQHIVRFSNTA